MKRKVKVFWDEKKTLITYIEDHFYILELLVYVPIVLVIFALLYRFGYFDIFIKF